MKFKLISDVHVEFHSDGGMHFCQTLPTDDVDVLIVAGDFGTTTSWEEPLQVLLDRFPQVCYVPGNHEYYGSHIDAVNDKLLQSGQRHANLHVLINDTVTLGDVVVAGSTAWFACTPDVVVMKRMSNDFRVIKDLTFERLEQLHDKCQMFLNDVVKSNTLVVTHYLPLEDSVDARWKGSPANCFFVTDCSNLVQSREPRIWCHGHTHAAKDYHYGRTRVICNPLGYPHEGGMSFNDGLTFDA